MSRVSKPRKESTTRDNRLDLLKAFDSLGADLGLSAPISRATKIQIANAWETLHQSLWVFSVSDGGTLDSTDQQIPGGYGDVFGILNNPIDTMEYLILQVGKYQDLQNYLLRLAPSAYQVGDGCEQWLREQWAGALPRIKSEIEDWLDDSIDWMALETWEPDHGSQSRALRFFDGLGLTVTDELGVTIVEGDHPGSSYYAAELQGSISRANAAAVKVGSPIRFIRDTV